MLDVAKDVCPLLSKLPLPSNNKKEPDSEELVENYTLVADKPEGLSACLYQDKSLPREWFDTQIVFLRSLTPEERNLLRSYTRNGDEVINLVLRGDRDLKNRLMRIVEKLKTPTSQLSLKFIDEKGYRVPYDGLTEITKRTNFFDVELDTITEANVIQVATRYVNKFQDLMKRVPPVTTPFRVFRGVAPEEEDAKKVYPLRGYSSTSYDPFTASIDIFTNQEAKCCVMDITLAKGVRALWIEPISHFEEEREILIDSTNVTTEIDYANPTMKQIVRIEISKRNSREGKPVPIGKGPIETNVYTCAVKPRTGVLGYMAGLVRRRGGMYWPDKYHRGLTRRQNAQRKRTATRRAKMSWKNPKAYAPWKTDQGVKTRRSSYSSRFHAKYPGVKSLPEIATATGVPLKTLQTVYNRGMAAWRTGHRPGASAHGWGMARVHSFVLHGKTWRTADADLSRQKE